jgi:hypothetical protein
VTHVVLTPLQLYSVSNVLAFDQAEICQARRGWVHFHTTHRHPPDVRSTSIPPEILVRVVTDAEGLELWWSDGHGRASLVVEIATKPGG